MICLSHGCLETDKMEHRGGEAKESGPCSISVSLGRYLSFSKSKLLTWSPSVLGKGVLRGEAAWGPGRAQHTQVWCSSEAQPAEGAMPEPCPHPSSPSRPARAGRSSKGQMPCGESPPPPPEQHRLCYSITCSRAAG